jgi:deazaflavin-dependent oxidoreductase (nitroreductase family)
VVDRSRARVPQRLANRLVLVLFRLRRGRVRFRGVPTLVLHTTGRRTGRPRRTPLLYLDVGDGTWAIVGSNGGDDRTPAWVLNLAADADVEVEVGGARRAVHATVAPDDRRAQLWPRFVAAYGDYATYQARTDRQIPVVLLTPKG